MPIAKEPTPPSPADLPRTVPATLTGPVYRTYLNDTKVNNLTSLITHIEGMSWTADIYSQLLRENENTSPYQPNQLAPYQQYLFIKEFELKLQGSLEPSHNTSDGTMELSGTARVYPVWHPHAGDVIVANIGDGQLGQFTVTQVRRLSLYQNPVYEIDFELARIADEPIINDLQNRVVKRTTFQEDFLTYGQNPILADDQLGLNQEIDAAYGRLLREWLHGYFSNEYSTMLLPGQVAAIYDPYLIRAMLLVFSTEESPYIRRIKELNVSGIRPMEDYSVLDALVHVDESYLLPGHHEFGIVNRRVFPRTPTMNGIYVTGITHVVYPRLIEKHVDIDYGSTAPSAIEEATPIGDVQADLESLIPDNVSGEYYPGDGGHPLFHAVLHDNGYIFSTAFYTEATTGQSNLELLVRQALQGQLIDTAKLMLIIRNRHYFGRLEHFYYDFVLLVLLKIAKRQI